MDHDTSHTQRLSRRAWLKFGAAGLVASAATAQFLDLTVLPVNRLDAAAPNTLPDIQFDIRPYLGPIDTIDGLQFQFGPQVTKFVTFKLDPKFKFKKKDQKEFADALDQIESMYEFSRKGVLMVISYGLPYFRRLPTNLVSASMPRLLSDTSRYALEEAVVSPTDVSSSNPGIQKPTFNIPVKSRITTF